MGVRSEGVSSQPERFSGSEPGGPARAVDVQFRAVTKRFGADVVAVDAVDLDVYQGEFLSLLGPSGCGKTTSLRMIAGFEQPTSGEILIGGVDAVGVPPVPPRRQHRLPAVRAVPAHDGARQRGLRAEAAQGRQGRAPSARAREALELVQLHRARGAQAARALGRPAAARRAGPGAGDAAAGAAARRAARRARPEAAQGDADRAEASADARSASPSST